VTDADAARPVALDARRPAGQVADIGRPRVVAYTDNVQVGGAEMSLVTLIRALGDRVEPTVMGSDTGVLEWISERVPGVPAVLVPPVHDKRHVRPIAAHVRAIRHLRPDILHANLHHSWSGSYGVLGALLAPGVKTVLVEHSLWPPSNRIQQRLRRLLVGRVDAHVAVSSQLARDIEEVLGQPDGSIETIHNGVPDLELAPLARRHAGPTIGFVGRLAHEKGADLLLRAVVDLPEATVVVVGDGPERERLASELGIRERIDFIGWSDDVRRLLPTFDVLAQPSRWEGFGISIVEAMLARLPVVAARVGGVSEVVVDGVTGTLVPPEDQAALAAALGALLADAGLRTRMGDAGREIAGDRFTDDTMARAFASVYARVLA
jgi:glycosyltransferase involved in cell wall biosynthesis